MANSSKSSSICSYCAELAGDRTNSYFLKEVADEIGVDSRYLFTSKSFLVFPSVGALVDGHLLVVPKTHITAMAYLNKDQLYELEGVIAEVGALLGEIYKTKVIAMEHGVIDEKKSTGVCVTHAHIHMMPTNFNLVGSIKKEKKKVSLQDLCEARENEDDYLFYTNDLNTYYFSELGELPPQFLRKVIFNASNLEGSWNWRQDKRATILRKTIDDVAAKHMGWTDRKASKKWLYPTLLMSRSGITQQK